ncbi:hypothetical protein KAR91_33140 [Candidatus Pacearchaeota archaeon]|nr:hypothetical protein [Candidatus Pacearchaeota archaeon]
MSKGIEAIKEAIKRDISEDENCFNENGCPKTRTKCFHKYCDKFQWIMERAEHYADKLGCTKEEIIDKWEKGRNYWYMNYYQDSRMPLIEGCKVFETKEELLDSIGKDGFRCPKCEGISKDPYTCSCEDCDWKSYGLFGTLGKGVDLVIKSTLDQDHIFMPVVWEASK